MWTALTTLSQSTPRSVSANWRTVKVSGERGFDNAYGVERRSIGQPKGSGTYNVVLVTGTIDRARRQRLCLRRCTWARRGRNDA
jgi:hypothetical protein